MIGKKFGRWRVTNRAPDRRDGTSWRVYWWCTCRCGTEREVAERNLLKGASLSCGCLARERSTAVVFKDLKGLRFGRLVVRRRYGYLGRRIAWQCRCDCGKTRVVAGSHLVQGLTVSCGCRRVEAAFTAHYKHGAAGHTGSRGAWPEYRIWKAMKDRCSNPNSRDYQSYGGRGVTMCARWRRSFGAFIADVGRRPRTGVILGLRNKFGNYTPGNTAWMTPREGRMTQRRMVAGPG